MLDYSNLKYIIGIKKHSSWILSHRLKAPIQEGFSNFACDLVAI
jgi:hypothetical protein